MLAVQQTGWALRSASRELQGDRDVVLLAVKKNGIALEFASLELHGEQSQRTIIKVGGRNIVAEGYRRLELTYE